MKTVGYRDLNPVLTVPEVAAFLRVADKCVYKLIADGRLKATKIGNTYRILKKDVMAVLEQ